MPTARTRHQVTETPEVARALDVAARRWPGEPRSRLLLRLVDVGGSVLERDSDDAIRRHRAAVEATAGKYSGVFGPGYLAELRRDWPD